MESSLEFRASIKNLAKKETNKEMKIKLLQLTDQYREDLKIKGNISLKVRFKTHTEKILASLKLYLHSRIFTIKHYGRLIQIKN